MNNRERLFAFFEAENKRDWGAYRNFLHPDVRWTLHSKETQTICGVDAYLSAMIDAYAENDNTFKCEGLYENNTENRIVTILVNNLNERSCDVFEFKDGLIHTENRSPYRLLFQTLRYFRTFVRLYSRA